MPPAVQLPPNNNVRTFSMRSQDKVYKFLRKADEALLKLFELPENSESFVDQLLLETQQPDEMQQ